MAKLSIHPDNQGLAIVGRVIGPSGAEGNEFQINTFTPEDQTRPYLAMEPNWGGILAAWQSQGSAGDDDSGSSIQARRLAPDATPEGADFQVNTMIDGDQYQPWVVPHPSSRDFIILWRDPARILAADIKGQITFFADGFETGDTSAWTTVPSLVFRNQ